MVPDAHARADDDARRAARLDAATTHLASIAPDRRARARRRVRMDAMEARARSRRRGARAVSYIGITTVQQQRMRVARWMDDVRAGAKSMIGCARARRARVGDRLPTPHYVFAARGRRDLSTQLTTRIDCGEYNRRTRSRDSRVERLSRVPFRISLHNRTRALSAIDSEILTPYTARAMSATSAREHASPRHAIIARAKGWSTISPGVRSGVDVHRTSSCGTYSVM